MLSQNQQIYKVDSAENKSSKFIIFVGLVVLNKDPTVWLDEARPPKKHFQVYKKLEWCINDIWFSDKIIQRWKFAT